MRFFNSKFINLDRFRDSSFFFFFTFSPIFSFGVNYLSPGRKKIALNFQITPSQRMPSPRVEEIINHPLWSDADFNRARTDSGFRLECGRPERLLPLRD